MRSWGVAGTSHDTSKLTEVPGLELLRFPCLDLGSAPALWSSDALLGNWSDSGVAVY